VNTPGQNDSQGPAQDSQAAGQVGGASNPYFASHREQDAPDLDANAPLLRSSEDQRLNRKALGFLAGIILLLVVAAIFIYRSATSGEEDARRPAEEQIVIPELPRELPPSTPPIELARTPELDQPELPPLPMGDGAVMPQPRPGDFAQGPQQPSLMERRMASTAGAQQQESGSGSQSQDPFVQAMLQANGIAPAKAEASASNDRGTAQFLNSPDALLVRGTYIRCVLAMRIVTDIPGFTSCVVAEPVYSFNGRRMLVPKGSRILGRYDTDATGPRVAVIWDRITTPTGIDINMVSPGVDGLGGAGHPGDYSAHWPSRIASALLISLISDGFKYAGEKNGPKTTAYYGNGAVVEQPFESNTARSMQRLADQAVERSASRPATVTVNQGTVLNVYVAQDIDFTGVMARLD
jgi:type IV secretion system protein VirB10